MKLIAKKGNMPEKRCNFPSKYYAKQIQLNCKFIHKYLNENDFKAQNFMPNIFYNIPDKKFVKKWLKK